MCMYTHRTGTFVTFGTVFILLCVKLQSFDKYRCVTSKILKSLLESCQNEQFCIASITTTPCDVSKCETWKILRQERATFTLFRMPNNRAMIVILADELNKQTEQSILKNFEENWRLTDISPFTDRAEEEVKYYCFFLHKNQTIVWNQHIHNLKFPKREKSPNEQEQKNRSNHEAVG